MFSNINDTNNELTKYIISSFKENNMLINELILQKVVYAIKMDLGENHQLYNDLPFYWYCYGPFSETIRLSFLSFKKFLNPVNTYFSLNDAYVDDFKSNIINKVPEIENTTNKLISKGNYIYSSLAEDIYKDFAPLNMLHKFRYGIFNPTENEVFNLNGDEYVKKFKDCMLDLYLNQFNNEYNLLFAKLQSHIDLLNDENLIEKCWGDLRNPIRNLWFTFAQGLRIKAHDSYYNNKCDNWKIIFDNYISKLDNDINAFVYKTNEMIDLSKYGEITKFDKEFMGSLLDVYLGDD